MRINRRILSIMAMSLLIFSTLSILWVPLFQVSAQSSASLTGTIYDSGVDTDSDGSFDFLEVGVEVNVSTSGTFVVDVAGLFDSAYHYIGASNQNITYLGMNIQVVYVSLDGPTIYASGFNPTSISKINLYDEYYNPLDSISYVSLSREYNYTEFDRPPASLTGTIYDRGVDTNGNGAFNYLEVGVEVNVSTSGIFVVEISGLLDSAYHYISVWSKNSTYLDVGIQVVYVSLDGPTIYASGFNPTKVSDINLNDEYRKLGYLNSVPLSREYNYTEFDSPPPPPAFLTGTIVDDRGVDTDGNGAFDYLEVGVEVNVTDPREYRVEILGLQDSGYNYISVSGYESEYLSAGLQVVDVLLYGPTIYVSGKNPVNISDISLYSVEYVPPFSYITSWLGSINKVPLSREYAYTEFDSPLIDAEAIFVVYPDGRIVMGGTLNYTHMEPLNTGPSIYGDAEIKKSDGLTLVSADFTLIVPPEEASQFPFNSSAFTLLSEYSGDILTNAISGSTVLPPSIASEFPFNATDFTVMGEYIGNIVTGNVTIDIVQGFPLEDLRIDFHGNKTYVQLDGSSTVIYGTYPEIGEINATFLEDLLQQLNSTIPGHGPDSLYNMTKGLFECTRLNTTITPYNAIGATVNFEAEFQGDLIQTLVNMTGQPASLYEVLNTTWSSIEGGSFVLTYSHAVKEADINIVFSVDMTNLIDGIIPILPEIPSIPPELASFAEAILNTTYCTVNSVQVSLGYENGQVTLTANATIQDDFNLELNYIKNMFLIYGVPQPLTLQLQTVNETRIDLTDFRMSINLTETSEEVDVSGFAVLPPLDWINATSFRLNRFFNTTASGDEPPREGERLKVTVEGGSNGTHAVRIFRPETVPEPDMTAPGGMVWNNQSISGLKDLIFQIGSPDSTPPDIGTPAHEPEVPGPGEDVTVSVNVTDADTGIRPDGVILSYSTDGGETWNNVTMSKTTGDTYEGIIPGLSAGTQVKYMIIAYDYAGNEAVQNMAGEYYVYTVVPEFPTWQIIALALLLIGISLGIAKKLQNITKNRQNKRAFTKRLLGTLFH